MYKIWKRLGLLKMFDTVEKAWLAKSARLSGTQSKRQVFLRCFSDLIRVQRIDNQAPRIRQNQFPRITEIRFVQVHSGYLTFSLTL